VCTLDTHDVHVGHEEHGLLGTAAAQPGDDGRAQRRGLEQSRLDASPTQSLHEILRELKLVAGRIGRVEADQRSQVLDRLETRAVPVGLTGCGQRVAG